MSKVDRTEERLRPLRRASQRLRPERGGSSPASRDEPRSRRERGWLGEQ